MAVKKLFGVVLVGLVLLSAVVVEAGWFGGDEEDDSHTHEDEAYQFVDGAC